ncbi:GNAT family N-acetyltransferase [bacterium]|nr:GNAT family N-acetyltransferase [bacterium]
MSEPSEIRGIRTPAELEAVADLYGRAFHGYGWHYTRYLNIVKRLPKDQWRLSRTLWGADGKPISHVRICDRTMRLGAALLRVGGIGDVCTDPFRRKRGTMRRVFADVIQVFHDEPYELSLLWGIPRFYDKFGFTVALSRGTLQMPREQAARFAATWRGRRMRKDDAAAVRRLFAADLKTRDGGMERPDPAWVNRANREDETRVLADGKARAYYRCRLEEDALLLNEVSLGARPTREAVEAVLADMVRVAKKREKPNLRFDLSLGHPVARFCVADGCSIRRHTGHRGGGMARIGNLETLCERMAPEWERLLAASTLAGWRGTLRLDTDIGRVDLVIARGRVWPRAPEGRADARLVADQDKLTRLVLGFHDVETARLLGEARFVGDALPLAAVLFPERHLDIFEHDHF